MYISILNLIINAAYVMVKIYVFTIRSLTVELRKLQLE